MLFALMCWQRWQMPQYPLGLWRSAVKQGIKQGRQLLLNDVVIGCDIRSAIGWCFRGEAEELLRVGGVAV